MRLRVVAFGGIICFVELYPDASSLLSELALKQTAADPVML